MPKSSTTLNHIFCNAFNAQRQHATYVEQLLETHQLHVTRYINISRARKLKQSLASKRAKGKHTKKVKAQQPKPEVPRYGPIPEAEETDSGINSESCKSRGSQFPNCYVTQGRQHASDEESNKSTEQQGCNWKRRRTTTPEARLGEPMQSREVRTGVTQEDILVVYADEGADITHTVEDTATKERRILDKKEQIEIVMKKAREREQERKDNLIEEARKEDIKRMRTGAETAIKIERKRTVRFSKEDESNHYNKAVKMDYANNAEKTGPVVAQNNKDPTSTNATKHRPDRKEQTYPDKKPTTNLIHTPAKDQPVSKSTNKHFNNEAPGKIQETKRTSSKGEKIEKPDTALRHSLVTVAELTPLPLLTTIPDKPTKNPVKGEDKHHHKETVMKHSQNAETKKQELPPSENSPNV